MPGVCEYTSPHGEPAAVGGGVALYLRGGARGADMKLLGENYGHTYLLDGASAYELAGLLAAQALDLEVEDVHPGPVALYGGLDGLIGQGGAVFAAEKAERGALFRVIGELTAPARRLWRSHSGS